ncbi:MAG: DUF2062 domain-containing protein [Polyangiaceae bacterium]
MSPAEATAPPPRPFSLLREELKRAWRELRGDGLSPARGAAAVAIGLFIGSQPIFGLHTPLVLFFCIWLRLDAAVAWLASNISNPFFAWALLSLEVQVGAYILTGAPIHFGDEAHALGLSELLWRYSGFAFLGAPAVGAALAAVGAAITWGVLAVKRMRSPTGSIRAEPYRLPPEAPPWLHAIERVATRYSQPEATGPNAVASSAQRSRFHYARTKLMGDPVARLIVDIAKAEKLGQVVDIGCGRGQLAILLLELGLAARVHGLDWDASKVENANLAAAAEGDGLLPLDAHFSKADARQAEIEPADTVLLIDVLHYFTAPDQDTVLRRAAAAVRPGGRLLVREADAARGWRSWLTLVEERVFTFLRFNRGAEVCFRPAAEIVAVLEGAGMEVEVRPAWGKTPFSNVLFVAHRRAGGG